MAVYCQQCGQEVNDTMKFCPGCGTPVPEPVVEKEPAKPVCGGCGTELKENDKFCGVCGTPVPAPIVEKEPAKPVCSGCGAELKDDDAFCGICGTPVKQAKPVQQPIQQPVQTQTIPVAQQPVQQPVQTQTIPVAQQPVQQPVQTQAIPVTQQPVQTQYAAPVQYNQAPAAAPMQYNQANSVPSATQQQYRAMKDRKTIKKEAREKLKGRWGMILLAGIIASFIGGLGSIAFGVGALFTMPPMMVGLYYYLLKFNRNQGEEIGDVFYGFQRFGASVGGFILKGIFTSLWSLLFVIPGIVKTFAYSMTEFIIADFNCSGAQAIKISNKITQGHKGKIFVMYLSFFWWFLLVTVTFGIAMIYVFPYILASYAGLYEEIKEDAIRKGILTQADMAA